jgi:outer membrane protein
MSRIPLRCFLGLLLLPMAVGAQQKWDLKQCVDYAVEHNISVQQQDIQARLAELTYKQSSLSQYPSLNLGSSLGLNTGRSIDRTTNLFTTQSIFYNGFGLQAAVDLFNFGSKQYTISGNRLSSQAATAAVDKLKNDISLNVAGSYLQVLLNREQVAISNVQVSQTLAQLSSTRKQVQAGALPELNAAQLEAQLAQDSATLITAQGTEVQSLLYLKALLNLDAATPFDIVTPPVDLIPIEPLSELQPDAVYQQAVANLPQQRVNTLRLQAAQKYAAAQKALMYPNLSLAGNIQTNYSSLKNNPAVVNSVNSFVPIGVVKTTLDTVLAPVTSNQYRFYANPYGTQLLDNFTNGLTLSLSVPIFNGGSARTSWKKAQLNVRSSQLQQEQDNRSLKQDIYKAYTDAVTAIEKYNASKKAVVTAQRAYDFASKRYGVGLLNTLDLITQQATLTRARSQQTLAQYDYVFKMKVLEFYKGQGLKL